MNTSIEKYNLHDYIVKIDDFLDQDTCKNIVKKTSKLNWQTHGYYDSVTNTHHSYDNELHVLHTKISEVENLNKNLSYAIDFYLKKINLVWFTNITGYNYVRLNRYDKNTLMRLHCDHIHSIFDGNNKGVPVLTVLGALNDNYTGGEFLMFGNEPIELKAGNVIIFPSNFLYPHEVRPVKTGTRYSFVSWGW